MKTDSRFGKAAYGGEKWSPRTAAHREEIGRLWEDCGVNSEWRHLETVLLHPPGPELLENPDPESIQMLSIPNLSLARSQHEAIALAYQENGVTVQYVDPTGVTSPNLIFCADLLFMTPEGVILARPASTVRAGEERWIARRLADLGIPILRTLRGNAVFEGADALWLDLTTLIIGRGLRTNDEAIFQISGALSDMGVEVLPVDLPIGTMHLMGILRFIDRDLAIAWPYRIAWGAVDALNARGYKVVYIPEDALPTANGGLNFVTLGPRKILMAAGFPAMQNFLESHGVTCLTVDVDELLKAAGGIACMTGILKRKLVDL